MFSNGSMPYTVEHCCRDSSISDVSFTRLLRGKFSKLKFPQNWVKPLNRPLPTSLKIPISFKPLGIAKTLVDEHTM
jgi:hypothetical protein